MRNTKNKNANKQVSDPLKPVMVFGIFAAVFFLDQLTKFLIRKSLAVGETINFLPFLHIVHVENSGSFFGIAKHSNGFLAFFAVLVIGLVVYNYKELPKEKFLYALAGLILGAAAGNLIDRVLFGSVTDFIDILVWPVFNVADIAVTFSIIGLLYYVFRKD